MCEKMNFFEILSMKRVRATLRKIVDHQQSIIGTFYGKKLKIAKNFPLELLIMKRSFRFSLFSPFHTDVLVLCIVSKMG